MEMGGLMGGLYRISEWIMRFSGANLLWFICSLPALFILAMFLFGMSPETAEEMSTILSNPEQYLISVTISIFVFGMIASIFLFPATSALFSVARKWVMGEEDVSVFKTFFKSYKSNYKQSLLGGFMYTILFTLIIDNILFYNESSAILSVIFLILLVFSVISLFHFFSILSHLHMKTLGLMKNALLITLGKPLTSLLVIASNVFIVFLSIKFTFLIIFFVGSGIAFVSFFYFYRAFQKIQLMQEQQAEITEEDEKA